MRDVRRGRYGVKFAVMQFTNFPLPASIYFPTRAPRVSYLRLIDVVSGGQSHTFPVCYIFIQWARKMGESQANNNHPAEETIWKIIEKLYSICFCSRVRKLYDSIITEDTRCYLRDHDWYIYTSCIKRAAEGVTESNY